MNDHSTAVITGANSDIGRAIAARFLREGFRLVLLSRRMPELDAGSGVPSGAGAAVSRYQVDFEDSESTNEVFAEIAATHRRIRLLVNNAALTIGGKVTDFNDGDAERMFRVNCTVPLLTARALLPAIERDSGDIVNIASTAGLRGVPGASAYSASKAALANATGAMNAELSGRNVRCTAICPEMVNTSFLDSSNLSVDYRQKLLQPEDIASLVHSIVSLPRHLIFDPISVKCSRK